MCARVGKTISNKHIYLALQYRDMKFRILIIQRQNKTKTQKEELGEKRKECGKSQLR